jgi:hypothetical protein
MSLLFTEKDRCQKFKYQIWIMSIISFGNPDVILLFRDKHQYFKRVFYFLGIDVIFDVSPMNIVCRHVSLFFLQKKDRCQNFKYQIWIMSIIISFGNSDVTLFYKDKCQYFRRVF